MKDFLKKSWYIDSRCSKHITGDASKFTHISPKKSGHVTYGDSMTESTEETIELTLSYAKKNNLCKPGDSVVALHRLESSTVIKILDVC